ncbi:MAG: hypothetical protein AB8B86_14560 [Pseudomonadales bacterium]
MTGLFAKLFGNNDIEKNIDRKQPNGDDESARRLEAGWLFKDEKASVIWESPKPVNLDHPKSNNAKSASVCPAAIQFDRLHYAINCPVDLHLRFVRGADGETKLTNVDGAMSSVRPAGLQKILVVSPPEEWRHPSRPIIQIATPFVFVADQNIYVNQFPPFLHYPKNPLPGVQICGRFPIDVWPRMHMWALEWHDMDKDLILKRGEPLFYVRFESEKPGSVVRLVEAERTPELLSYISQITDVTNYVNQSFQLFEAARERRPETLLVAKKKN